MVVKLSDFLTTSLVLTSLDSADVIRVMRNSTIGIDSNTTGDYIASITGGTGITATSTGHAAAATIAVDNTVVTTDSSQTLTNKTINLTNNTLQMTLNQLNASVSGATLVSLTGAETLTNKILTSPTINGGSFSSGSVVDISTFGLRDVTTTAYETRIRSINASPILTADRTLSLDVNNADRTISLTGNLTLGGSFTTSGAHNTSFITSGNTSLNLPTSGTLLSYNDSNAASITGAFSAGTLTGKYLGFDSDFTAKSTSDLSEGTNLYYTTARADSAFDDRLATKTTSNLTEGTNLYYTTARADSAFDDRLATKSTTNLSEGSNLYYTTARADSAIDDRVTKTFVDALNINADTVDNLEASQFLRADVDDSAAGNITIGGDLIVKGQGPHKFTDGTVNFEEYGVALYTNQRNYNDGGFIFFNQHFGNGAQSHITSLYSAGLGALVGLVNYGGPNAKAGFDRTGIILGGGVSGYDSDIYFTDSSSGKWKMWHQKNQGSGSGMDADKLDGQEGSYYRIDVYDASGTLLN